MTLLAQIAGNISKIKFKDPRRTTGADLSLWEIHKPNS